MKIIGHLQFPETREEAATWQPYVAGHAIHSRVLLLAKTRVEGQWKAYIGIVPGHDHNGEWTVVEREGDPMREEDARHFFPEFEGIPYAK